MCCYEREAFTLQTTIIVTTAQDGCTTTAIKCRMHGNKAKMDFQMENSCPKHLMESQVDELERKVDSLEVKVDTLEDKVETVEDKVGAVLGKVDVVEGKVDMLKQLVCQNISKTGK